MLFKVANGVASHAGKFIACGLDARLGLLKATLIEVKRRVPQEQRPSEEWRLGSQLLLEVALTTL